MLINILTQIPPDSIFFQIVLRFIIVAINIRLIPLAVNNIAIRNKKRRNISEYIISTVVIFAGMALFIINWKNNNLDVNGVIFCIFNTILGIMLMFDAEDEML